MEKNEITLQDVLAEISAIKKFLLERKNSLFTEKYLSSSEFMIKAEIGRTKMHGLIREGIIKPTKKGGRLYFHKSELKKLFTTI